jgi:hypothetical protein
VPATLHRLADEEGVDLVVLSAHGDSGGNRFLYGGVVTSFVLYGSTSALIVQDVPMHEIQPNPAELRASQHEDLRMPHGTFLESEDSWPSMRSGSRIKVTVSSPTDLPLPWSSTRHPTPTVAAKDPVHGVVELAEHAGR